MAYVPINHQIEDVDIRRKLIFVSLPKYSNGAKQLQFVWLTGLYFSGGAQPAKQALDYVIDHFV